MRIPTSFVSNDQRILTPEQQAAVASLRSIVQFWGITYEELTCELPKAEAAEPVANQAIIKYRHPVSGLTWDGEGLQPDWLKRALVQEGYRVVELRVAD